VITSDSYLNIQVNIFSSSIPCRVLRPPGGGGSSNLFGTYEEDTAPTRRSNKMSSGIFDPAEETREAATRRSNPPGLVQSWATNTMQQCFFFASLPLNFMVWAYPTIKAVPSKPPQGHGCENCQFVVILSVHTSQATPPNLQDLHKPAEECGSLLPVIHLRAVFTACCRCSQGSSAMAPPPSSPPVASVPSSYACCRYKPPSWLFFHLFAQAGRPAAYSGEPRRRPSSPDGCLRAGPPATSLGNRRRAGPRAPTDATLLDQR